MTHAAKEVLLIQPWIEDFYMTDCRKQPIGLCYIAGNLRKHFPGIDVKVYDALASSHKRTIQWPPEFSYLKPYFGYPDSGPFALFHQYYRFGASKEETIAALKRHNPFLIGISCLFSPYYRESLKMAELCKNIFPDVPIVMGGNHASMFPETLLTAKTHDGKHLCDMVLRGEGEESFCTIVSCLLDGKPPAARDLVTRETINSYKKEITTPDRSGYAPADIFLLDKNAYTHNGVPMSFLVTSRSCPHRCSFCTIHEVFGNKYETVPTERVISEIKELYAHGIKHFDIEDDNFTFDPTHAKTLLKKIIELSLPVTLSAMNGLSSLSMDEEIIFLMKKAGFSALNLAMVSQGNELRHALKRPHDQAHLLNVIESANTAGLSVSVSFILGLPGQTLTEMWKTIKLLSGKQCLLQPSPFYFTPGSQIYKEMKDSSFIFSAAKDKDPFFSARLTSMDVETKDFSREDIFTLWRLTRVLNFIKECLDKPAQNDDTLFFEALNVFKSHTWDTNGGKEKHELPFSKKIAAILSQDKLTICGHRTSSLVDIPVN